MSASEAAAHVPRRLIAAVRVSQERDGMTSPENQRFAIEQKVARDGDRIIDWIEGIDQSGSSLKSAWWPTLFRAVERIEVGEADGIVVWQYSRTARHRLKWPEAIYRIEQAGGTLESATEQLDTSTAAGRFSRDLIAAHNVMQAELIGETWRETHERRRRHGLPPTGGPRFGYRVVTEQRSDGRLVAVGYEPDPLTGPLLAEMYRRFLGGAGSAQLTRWLNETGVPGPRGERWTYQTLLRVLDSGFAAGLLSKTRVKRGNQVVTPPCWEREYVPGAHAALIDVETWQGYIAARAQRTRQVSHNPDRYVLTGLLRCGECGGRMHGRSSYSSGTDYCCSTAYSTSGVQKVTIRANLAERAVEQWLFALATDVNAAASAAAVHRGRIQEATFTARSLEKRVEQASNRITTLTIRLADGTISDVAYRAAVEQIEREQREAEARLAELAPNPVRAAAPAQLSADLVKLWPRMTGAQRASVLRPLIDHIVVAPVGRVGRATGTERVRIVPAWEADPDGVLPAEGKGRIDNPL